MLMLRRYSAELFSAAIALIFLACVWLIPSDVSSGKKQWIAEVVQEYGFASSDDQRLAHLVAVVAVAIFSLLLFLLSQRGAVTDRGARIMPGVDVRTGAFLLFGGFVTYSFLVPAAMVLRAAIFMLFVLVLLCMAGYFRRGLIERISIAFVGAYLAVLIVPGLLVRPIPFMFDDPVLLAQIETHLLSLSMRGAALAAGQNFFNELRLDYGLLMPSIMSLLEVKRQGLSVAQQLRFVQLCQVLFCLTAAFAYLLYRRRNYIGVLAALLLAAPFWSTAGLGIWHPNQTGFRSLGLALGMLTLVAVRREPVARAAWWLGTVAGAALLINLETTVAVVAGFVVFLTVRTRSIPVTLLLRMFVAIILVVAAYCLLYPLAFGRFPFGGESLDILSLLKRFAGGGGYGLRLFSAGHASEGYFFVPFALAMFLHVIYVVVDGFRRLGRSPLSRHRAIRVAISATLIVWLAYYFNSPNWWQIWTVLFLYGFLIIDLVDRRRFGIRTTGSVEPLRARFARMRLVPGLLILLFFLSFLIPFTNRHLQYYTSAFMYPSWLSVPQSISVVSGILLPKEKADLLEAKAASLRRLNAEASGDLIYFTFNMAFMPRLSGVFLPGPYRDMFAETPGDDAFRHTMAGVLARRPRTILIDTPTGPLAMRGARASFQNRLRAALASAYQLDRRENGWEIWRPL